jgi:integrase/recombinase XerD
MQTINANPNFEAHLSKCVSMMRYENASKETIKNLEDRMSLFFRFLIDQEVFRLENVTAEVIDDYQTHLFNHRMENGNGYSVWTQTTYLATLSSFFRRLVRLKSLPFNPASEIRLPKRSQRLPKGVLTNKELKKFMNAPDRTTVYGYRDYCVISIFVSTGMRTSECCDLKIEDLDFDNGYITIREGKGLKDRVVPCSEPVMEDLKRFVTEIRPYLIKEESGDYLFIAQSGRKFNKHTVYAVFRKYSKSSKQKRSIIPRYFRYGLATEMIRKGCNLREIQLLLGHKSLHSLDAYCQVLQKDLKVAYKKSHPTETMP